MTYEEYLSTKPYIEKIAFRLMHHESKNGAKTGIPFKNYCEYKIDGRRFFCVMSNVFKAIIQEHIIISQQKFPECFGTGNADDVLKALYEIEQAGDFEFYREFLSREQFAYIFEYTENADFKRILRVDLYRKLDENDSGTFEFTGGIFHAFKHFSINGINLSIGKDINNINSTEELLIKVTKAFFISEGKFTNDKKYEVVEELDDRYNIKFSFFFEPETKEIYFINTVFKLKKTY